MPCSPPRMYMCLRHDVYQNMYTILYYIILYNVRIERICIVYVYYITIDYIESLDYVYLYQHIYNYNYIHIKIQYADVYYKEQGDWKSKCLSDLEFQQFPGMAKIWEPTETLRPVTGKARRKSFNFPKLEKIMFPHQKKGKVRITLIDCIINMYI